MIFKKNLYEDFDYIFWQILLKLVYTVCWCTATSGGGSQNFSLIMRLRVY